MTPSISLTTPTPRTALVATLVWALVGAANPASAQSRDTDWTPTAAVERQVRAHVAQRWGVDADALVLEWGVLPGGRGTPGDTVLAVDGSGSRGYWIATFPREDGGSFGVQLRTGLQREVVTAARALDRGSALSSSDMAITREVRWSPPGDEEPHPQVGWVTRRSVREGELLSPPAVLPPEVVDAGSTVEVRWESGTLRLTARGRALQNGRVGETVTVRLTSRRTVQGVVEGPNLIRIQG